MKGFTGPLLNAPPSQMDSLLMEKRQVDEGEEGEDDDEDIANDQVLIAPMVRIPSLFFFFPSSISL